jgi:large subunit ribosomal protein L10
MATEAKERMVESLREDFGAAKVAVFANFSKVTVEEVSKLRADMRASDTKLRVLKNTLARRAAAGTDVEVAIGLLKGPITVALGFGDDISAPAKMMINFSKEKKDKLTILGGVVEGSLVDAEGVKGLADMPPKPVVQAMLLGLMQAPARNFLSLMQNSARSLLNVLNNYAEKKKDEGQA